MELPPCPALEPADNLLHGTPVTSASRIVDTAAICDLLHLAITYLKQTSDFLADPQQWKSRIAMAGKLLKTAARRFGTDVLLAKISELPESSSPWLLLWKLQRTLLDGPGKK